MTKRRKKMVEQEFEVIFNVRVRAFRAIHPETVVTVAECIWDRGTEAVKSKGGHTRPICDSYNFTARKF